MHVWSAAYRAHASQFDRHIFHLFFYSLFSSVELSFYQSKTTVAWPCLEKKNEICLLLRNKTGSISLVTLPNVADGENNLIKHTMLGFRRKRCQHYSAWMLCHKNTYSFSKLRLARLPKHLITPKVIGNKCKVKYGRASPSSRSPACDIARKYLNGK